MGFGKGKGFSPPVEPPFPEDWDGPIELDIFDSRWTRWLRRTFNGATYLTTHNHPEATSVDDSSTRFVAQSCFNANYFLIDRKPLYFDTSSIPANAVITSAVLYSFITFVPGNEKDIHLVDAPDLHDPPVVADYGYLLGQTTSLGVLTTAKMVEERRCTWALNAAGIAAIVKGGQTKWGMRTVEDIIPSAPTETIEGIYLESEHTRLLVSYYVPD